MVLGALLEQNLIIWWLAQVAAVAILVILFLRWRPGFLGRRTIGETMGNALDQRSAQIQDQLEAAERSRQEAARLHQEAQQDIERARQEAQEIVARAATTSQSILDDMRVRAQEEYQRVVGQAQSQIGYERERAEMALQRRAADIVVDAAREVVERNLEPQTDRHIIDQSLANLKEIS